MQTASKRVDRRIPWLIVVPFVVVTLFVIWGFRTFELEEEISGRFPLGKEVKTVKIVADVGNVDLVIGSSGEVVFRGSTKRATSSQELLDRAVATPFTLEVVPGDDPEVFELRATPLPEGFLPLPPVAGQEHDRSALLLFRQLDARIRLPVDVAVEFEARDCHVRVDTRQAPTSIKIAKGSVMAIHVAGELTVRNGEGRTIVAEHRGPLDVESNGKTRVTLAEVVGRVRVVNDDGELGLYVPPHASIDLDARSLTGNVRNAFGFEPERLDAKGTVVKGKLGSGEYRVEAVSKAGTLTVDVFER